MGISEKLAYLNETKNQIKSALNTPYNVFRDYPTLISKYVKNQPKSIVEGSTVICENAIDLPCNVTVNSNSYQEKTDGYNLIDIQDIVSNLYLTVSNQTDISIDLETTDLTQDSTIYFRAKNLKAGVTYSIFALTTVLSGAISASTGRLELYNDKTWLKQIGAFNSSTLQSKGKFTVDTDGDYSIRYLVSSANQLTKTLKLRLSKLMIYEGDYTVSEKPYEPYTNGVATPNTDYQQEYEVIDGVNRFDKDNVEIGALSSNGTNNGDSNYVISNFIKGNNTFTFLYDALPTDHYIRIGYYDDKKIFVKRDLIEIEATAKKYTFNTTYPYIKISVQNNSIDTYQIVEGTEEKPYLPYGHIGLVQRGKNLLKFSKETENTYQSNGVAFTIKSKNVVNVKGTATGGNAEIFVIGYDWIADKDLLGLKNNIKYTANMKVNTPKVYGYLIKGASENVGTLYSESQTKTFIADENGISKILIRVLEGVTVDEDIEFQIEKGEVATNIEPYHEPIVHSIDLAGEKLAKVGEIADLLKISVNGSVKIGDKVIKEYIFTGDETWGRFTVAGSTTNYRHHASFMKGLIVGPPTNADVSNVLCNMLIAKSPNQTYLSQEGISIDPDGTIRIYSNKTKEMTTDEFKNWLKSLYEAGTPLRLLYETTEPTTIELPSIEPITTFEGITNVFELITNLGTTMKVEYIVNAEKINESEG